MKFTSAAYLEAIGGFCFFNEKSNVNLEFLHESLTDVSGGYILAYLASEGALVNHEVHAQRRLFDMNHFHCIGMLRVANGLSDGYIRNT